MLSVALTAMMLSASPQEAAPAPTAYAVKSEKKICKRVGQIGSRINSGKVCLTRAEWERIAQENRKEWEDKGSTGR